MYIIGYAEHMYKDNDNVLMAHFAEMGIHLPRKFYILILSIIWFSQSQTPAHVLSTNTVYVHIYYF